MLCYPGLNQKTQQLLPKTGVPTWSSCSDLLLPSIPRCLQLKGRPVGQGWTMSSRNRSCLFVPDERGLGGAMMIAQEYNNFFASQRARPSAHSYAAAPPSAQKLSYQRAAKDATSNIVSHDHLVRLGRMFTRLGSPPSTLSQQQQRPWSPTRTHQRARPGTVAADYCLWLPKKKASQEVMRPFTAPEQHTSSRSRSHDPQPDSGDSSSGFQQRDWQQIKAAAQPQPQPPLEPVQLPASRYYPGVNLLPSVQHKLYKASLMGDILSRQLYKAGHIRQLCVDFVHRNPPGHRSLLRQVAAEVLQELDVPYTTELDA